MRLQLFSMVRWVRLCSAEETQDAGLWARRRPGPGGPTSRILDAGRRFPCAVADPDHAYEEHVVVKAAKFRRMLAGFRSNGAAFEIRVSDEDRGQFLRLPMISG
ncbi:hypothetical protein GGE68_001987 [Rhizobium leguminosarum]|uniref:hypothetical protein n=1 Tax=Rhizobium leguminosarum TaxID=384 RepID=UPI0017B8F1E1|nr:hypothetical protein [Rhizobium leguminosarum]MBB5663797.1 hypothetical protein [Rhizobium leguminosarum]